MELGIDVVQATELSKKLDYGAISIPEVPDNVYIEILYNEAGAHFDPIKCSQYPHSSTADNCVRSLAILNERHTTHVALNT